MSHQNQLDFDRISRAITYLQQNFRNQPSLKDIAHEVDLSPSHFQKLFTDWAGTSPKQFLQYISIEQAKKLLGQHQTSLLKTSTRVGLSSSGRLHDLFIKIEGMTPGEYKNRGASLTINYAYERTPFGEALVASTTKGVCFIAFVVTSREAAREELYTRFPNAHFKQQSDAVQKSALRIFEPHQTSLPEIKLHLKGTPFQLKVWEALLRIPSGQLSTYGTIASQIGSPKAFRAVGTAVGHNPVSFLIPCHRVIQSSGILGNYHWGPARKTAMIGWEGARAKRASL